MSPLTTAFAGHADISEENTAAILDQFLPQDPPDGVGLGLVLIPERVPRLMKGLKAVIKWLEGEVGEDGTIPVPELIKSMLERREAEGDDLMLFLLFDPGNEDDVALATAANDAGIPIRNMAAAGDFLVFEEETPEEPVDDERPPWADETEADARVEGALAGEQAAADARSLALEQQLHKAAGLDVNITLDTLIKALARAIVTEMASLGAQQVAAHAGTVTTTAPVDAERPAEPVGRTETFPGAVAVYYHAVNGTWRKARGIARDGEVKIYMTEDEAKDAIAMTGRNTGPRSQSAA